jgi:ferric-dicitrate binding protein FerR (iron transport regulator)
MTKELLRKYLDGQCTNQELNEVLRWVKEEALNEKGRKLGFEDWNTYQVEDDLAVNNEKFTALFDRIQKAIGKDEKVQKKGRKNTGKVILFKSWLTRAAAMALIPVLGLLFYTLSEKRSLSHQMAFVANDSLEVIAPIGSRSVVQLSDGTIVHLNYGSRIKYPRVFNGDTRDIALAGEGFFDVSHNPEKPFIVKTKKVNVKALGTSFNVKAYPDNEIVSTTLVTGKVVMEQIEAGGSSKPIDVLKPGEHVEFNKATGAFISVKANVDKYIGWKDGKLIFEDTPVLEVAERLSRVFNVDILVDKEIEEYIYSVTFIDEPLFQILDLMAIATPIKYVLEPRKKLTDGTYSKQIINLKKR